TLLNQKLLKRIVSAPNDFGPPFALFHGKQGGKRVVFDRNCVDSFPEPVPVRMSDEQNRLFWVIDAAIGQTRLVVEDKSNAVAPRNVLRGDDDVVAPVDVGVKTNFSDFTARNFAADSRSMDHSGEDDVVDIAGATGDLVWSLFARDGGAD